MEDFKLDVIFRQTLLIEAILAYLILRSPSMKRWEKIAAALVLVGAIFGSAASRF